MPVDLTGATPSAARAAAEAFYAEEHALDAAERRQLYVFFEQQTRRMLLGFAAGVSIGAALPFLVRRRGTLVHPAVPVFGAVLGGSVLPGVANGRIYNWQVQHYRSRFGDESRIVRTLAVTPDPLAKCVFWSDYFRRSSNDPSYRLRDPAEVTDMDVDADTAKLFAVDAPSAPRAHASSQSPSPSPSPRPTWDELYRSDNSDSNDTDNNGDDHTSAWDRVRSAHR